MIVSIIKEIAESLIRNFHLLSSKNKKCVKEITSGLKSDGISIEKNFYTKDQCSKLISRIDDMISSKSAKVWVDDEASDHRIYFVNEIDESFNEFYEDHKVRQVLSSYTGTEHPKGMLLAAKIEFKEGNEGSGGGWHRDSPYTHQFKAICYLNDVNEDNGPFQYIKGSQSKVNVLKNYYNKIFSPGQYRFNETDIDIYLEKNNKEITTVTGEAGSLVFADTKGIHRGKPLKSGCRYVLFCYFWHKSIPAHFNELKQTE